LHGTHQFGERNKQAKLTSKHVDTIRRLQGRETQRSIASRFGISQPLVSLIQNGKVWPDMSR
jgi:predicted transcriptional regulator